MNTALELEEEAAIGVSGAPSLLETIVFLKESGATYPAFGSGSAP